MMISIRPILSYLTPSYASLLKVNGINKHISASSVVTRFLSTVENNTEIDSAGSSMPEKFESKFMQTMLERGFLHQCTDFKDVDKLLNTEIVSAYLGFDATAKSLHVGSLLQIMVLRHLQKCGHKPIVLVGGGTTKVGDPTGKDESRQLLSDENIQDNINSLTKVFEKYITFGDGPTDATIVNNDDWLGSLNYLLFLRDYGKHFTINRMLSFESVKQRLNREQPFSFLEFNYMLLQAYDFLELKRRSNVKLQFGGYVAINRLPRGKEERRDIQLIVARLLQRTSTIFVLSLFAVKQSEGSTLVTGKESCDL